MPPTTAAHPDKPDHYYILSIPITATLEEIKQAWKQAAFKFHPDKNHGNEEKVHAEMCKVNVAYQVLKDTTGQRREYNLEYPELKRKWEAYRRNHEKESGPSSWTNANQGQDSRSDHKGTGQPNTGQQNTGRRSNTQYSRCNEEKWSFNEGASTSSGGQQSDHHSESFSPSSEFKPRPFPAYLFPPPSDPEPEIEGIWTSFEEEIWKWWCEEQETQYIAAWIENAAEFFELKPYMTEIDEEIMIYSLLVSSWFNFRILNPGQFNLSHNHSALHAKAVHVQLQIEKHKVLFRMAEIEVQAQALNKQRKLRLVREQQEWDNQTNLKIQRDQREEREVKRKVKERYLERIEAETRRLWKESEADREWKWREEKTAERARASAQRAKEEAEERQRVKREHERLERERLEKERLEKERLRKEREQRNAETIRERMRAAEAKREKEEERMREQKKWEKVREAIRIREKVKADREERERKYRKEAENKRKKEEEELGRADLIRERLQATRKREDQEARERDEIERRAREETRREELDRNLKAREREAREREERERERRGRKAREETLEEKEKTAREQEAKETEVEELTRKLARMELGSDQPPHQSRSISGSVSYYKY